MILLVGFDSAWTPGNSGAIAALLLPSGGDWREIGPPQVVNYSEAEQLILDWQRQFRPNRTLVLLDQPTIMVNPTGQRPVEGIVAPSVSLRLGGMQPASQSRIEMFGAAAPVWNFLRRFGGAADPLRLTDGTQVIETYPVLVLIALRWLQNGRGVSGLLPKYNPQRTKAFSSNDWRFVCERAAAFFACHSTPGFAEWLSEAARMTDPKKSDQDCLDACLCLLVAMWLQQGRECIMVGNLATGYIVVPHDPALLSELASRCMKTGRTPEDWVRVFRLLTCAPDAESALPVPSVLERRGISHSGNPKPAPPPASPNQATKATVTKSAWTLPKIAALLDRQRQRATYGAVAGILGVLPRGLMNGRSKSPEYSWIVAASGTDRGRPTGYNDHEVHPECLRQIRAGVITRSEELLNWLCRSD
jgi:predicted RNase H-like nuclease